MNSNEISEFGRDTLGVRVMRVRDNEKLVSIAITPKNEDAFIDEQEEVLENENNSN